MVGADRLGKHRLFFAIAATVILVDVATKSLAASTLTLGVPHDVLGPAVRLALVYNPGAAFGLSFGPRSREIFLGLTVAALACVAGLHWTTRPGHVARTVAIGLVCGGAVGNLIDRVRSPAGVIDFIDVGVNFYRWPTFNVADMAVTTGALLLAWVLWMEDRVRDGGTTPVPEM